jgi:hypothetical protein
VNDIIALINQILVKYVREEFHGRELLMQQTATHLEQYETQTKEHVVKYHRKQFQAKLMVQLFE